MTTVSAAQLKSGSIGIESGHWLMRGWMPSVLYVGISVWMTSKIVPTADKPRAKLDAIGPEPPKAFGKDRLVDELAAPDQPSSAVSMPRSPTG